MGDDFDSGYIEALNSLEESVGVAIKLAGALNIESQVQISFDELGRIQDSLQSIEPLLSHNKKNYDVIRFNVEPKEIAEKITGNVVCIMVLSSKLGNLMIYAIISVKGRADPLGDWHAIGKPTVTIEELVDVPAGENATQQIKDSVDSIVESYSSEGLTTINFFKAD
ncbi:hypothetical protein WKI72_10155 [Candidatus Erwinia dacicola]